MNFMSYLNIGPKVLLLTELTAYITLILVKTIIHFGFSVQTNIFLWQSLKEKLIIRHFCWRLSKKKKTVSSDILHTGTVCHLYCSSYNDGRSSEYTVQLLPGLSWTHFGIFVNIFLGGYKSSFHILAKQNFLFQFESGSVSLENHPNIEMRRYSGDVLQIEFLKYGIIHTNNGKFLDKILFKS